MNREWNLWCSLSGTDVSDPQLKMAFNTDRRVALLSRHAIDVVTESAESLWQGHPDMSTSEFLDLWLVAVTAEAQRLEIEAQRIRDEAQRAKAEAERVLSAQRQAEEAAERERQVAAEAERQARAAVLRRQREEAEREWATEQARQRQQHLQRAAQVRTRIGYLYNITPIKNLKSIASLGILSHDMAAEIAHDDVSDRGVQEHRHDLHGFASLYFNPRNAMLLRLHRYEHRNVVVLRISPAVLDLPGVLIADGNAAASRSHRFPASEGLGHVDLDRIYGASWTTPDGAVDEETRRIMQAEVLVPTSIPPRWVVGLCAPSWHVLEEARRVAPQWPGQVDRTLFFED